MELGAWLGRPATWPSLSEALPGGSLNLTFLLADRLLEWLDEDLLTWGIAECSGSRQRRCLANEGWGLLSARCLACGPVARDRALLQGSCG
ncbi:hypothetical protein NDU88_004084 [Pleurodeles waltl]|uniref:Uncharacterized protein n=1 Tax=Pleurodeles waltl TaxID=8319 RepID=A0AAV7T7J3_PLEWA|nr:hypothetical protein NDU88_004084 [Pleurodeles waltl]